MQQNREDMTLLLQSVAKQNRRVNKVTSPRRFVKSDLFAESAIRRETRVIDIITAGEVHLFRMCKNCSPREANAYQQLPFSPFYEVRAS